MILARKNNMINFKTTETTKHKKVKLEKTFGGRNLSNSDSKYPKGITSGYSFHSKDTIKSNGEKDIRSKSTVNRYPAINDTKIREKIIPLIDVQRGRVKSINLDLLGVKPIIEMDERKEYQNLKIKDHSVSKMNKYETCFFILMWKILINI